MGRGIIFDEELLAEIEDAVSDGAQTNREIAEAIGVTFRSFKNYRTRGGSDALEIRKESIESAIKRGIKRNRQTLKRSAENGLIKLLEGYVIEDEITEITKHKDGSQTVKKKKTRKHFSPNVTAVIFELCNHAPNKYKSIHKMEEKDNSRGEIEKWLMQQAEEGRR